MTEAQLQQAVIEAAKLLGYRVCHFRPALTRKGWRTPVQGDVGFPDCVVAGHGRLILLEFKSAVGKLTHGQVAWVDELKAAGVEVYVVKPQDWTSGRVDKLLAAS